MSHKQRRTMRSYYHRRPMTGFRFLGTVKPNDWPKEPRALFDVLKSRGVMITSSAKNIIEKSSSVENWPETIDLVSASNRDLFNTSMIYDVRGAGKAAFDFDPCNVMIGLMARLTYNYQPVPERLLVVMEPVVIAQGPHILKLYSYLKRDQSLELWLDAEYAGSGKPLAGEFLFVEHQPK